MLRKTIPFAAVFVVLGALGSWVVIPYLHGQPVVPVVIPQDMASYRNVVKQVLPAVVSIETKGKAMAQTQIDLPRRQFFNDPRIPSDFRKLFEEAQKQPGDNWRFFEEFKGPMIPQHGFGSGFIVDPKGVILTNYHVVKDADQVVVQLQDGRKFTSKSIKTDPKTDLAIVQIETKDSLPFLQWADSDAMEIGDRVLAVGAPFGLRGSVSAGIVSGKGRNIDLNAYEDFLQTDAAINPGNSGGPLVNLEGKVIGVNTVIKTSTGGSQGVGLAIASNLAKNVVHQLRTNGIVHRGYLGMQIQTLAPDVANRLKIPDRAGVLVTRVMDNAPAAKGGLKSGDVITAIAGTRVRDARQLQRSVAAQAIGKAVEVTVIRDGQEHRLNVNVAEQPQVLGAAQNSAPPASAQERQPGIRLDKIGVELRDLTPALAKQLGYKDASGVIVAKVMPGTLADEAGLERGTIIVKVDNTHAVQSAADAKRELERASLPQGVLLQIKTPEHEVGYVLLEASTGS